MLSKPILWLALALMAHSQTPNGPLVPDTPQDYVTVGSLDVPSATAAVTTQANALITLAGWAFDCRSGLQPSTQRLGTVFVQWRQHVNGQPDTFYQSALAGIWTAQRPDVATFYRESCPAVGENVGFVLLASTPPQPGTWTMELHFVAIDSAGRSAEWMDSRQVTVQ